MSATYVQVEVRSVAELRAWLAEHHADTPGAWLVTWKRAHPDRHVGYEALVRELLCVGWIDGQAKSVDQDRSGLLITPRRPRSAWSRPNKLRIAELIEGGLMLPAGLAAVELAQRTGTWTALDDVENLIEPDELRTALDADPDARRHWDAFPRSVKRATLEWISTAKRPATKTQRITQAVELAAQNLRANRWPRPTS